MAKADLPAGEKNLAQRPLGAGAEQRFQQFGAAGPHQAGDAQNLAAMERKIDVLQPPLAGVAGPGERQVFDPQNFVARRARAGKIGFLDLAADHQMRDPPRIGLVAVAACRPSGRRAAR